MIFRREGWQWLMALQLSIGRTLLALLSRRPSFHVPILTIPISQPSALLIVVYFIAPFPAICIVDCCVFHCALLALALAFSHIVDVDCCVLSPL